MGGVLLLACVLGLIVDSQEKSLPPSLDSGVYTEGTNLRRDSEARSAPLSRPTCSALRGYPTQILAEMPKL